MKQNKTVRIRNNQEKKLEKAFALTEISMLVLQIFAFSFFFSLIFVGSLEKIESASLYGLDNPEALNSIFGNYIMEDYALSSTPSATTSDLGLGDFFKSVNTNTAGTTGNTNVANMDSNAGGAAASSTEKGFWFLKSKDAFYGNMWEGVQWSGYIFGGMQVIKSLFPEQENVTKAAGMGAIAGIMTGKMAYGAAQKIGSGQWLEGTFGPKTTEWIGGNAGGIGIGVGLAVGYLVFASQNKDMKEKEQSVEFKCMTWQAPRGGDDCNECNKNPLQPCSEYRCKSLGQTCKLINAGTGQERCIDSSPNDVTSPGIKPWKTVLSNDYIYADVQERPAGESGVTGHMTIKDSTSSDGCLKAFTPFAFGIITTDVGGVTQPGQCKIDFNHTKSMSEMNYYLGDTNLYIENHSQVMSLPGVDLLNTMYSDENFTLGIKNDGDYTLYIRCADGNGNENRDEFAVRFCIDKGPDATAPVIMATSIPTGSPVLYKVDNVSLEVYTNEPAECKWSRQNTDYETMETQMTCNNQVWEMNAELLYTCKTTLTGIEDKKDNTFFVKCKDKSERKNVMQQSYEFTLKGTQPLTILSVAPNGTIGSATSTSSVNLEIKTDNGYQNGEATCYYSTQNNTGDIAMFETGKNIHKQSLDLAGGNYNYYFKCVDLGGNTAYHSTSFNVFVDKYAPAIVRTYILENKIIVSTDEESSCKYSTTSCNFDFNKEGIIMPEISSNEKNSHYAEWKTDQNYYVKCSDKYNNQPEPTVCSMILRPFTLTIAED